MQIRTRLTLQFLLIGGIIMIVVSLAIYYSSVRFRQDDFYDRLRNKARSTARLLLDYGEIDADRLKVIEKDNPINLHNEKIIILDNHGIIIYSTDDKGEIEINDVILERVKSGRKLEYRQGLYKVMGTLYYVGNGRYVLIAAATDPAGILHLKDLRTILIEVCLISLLLFCIVGWFYSGRALKPISNVINKVEDISITSLHMRVPEGNGTDEIGRLANTFNKMLERLEKSFTMQKDFIANASHELRTPLTSINGQLDVLMMKERSTAEYKSAIGSVLDDIKSLIDLSNRLLLIARTSAEGPASLNKNLRIDEILWQAREEILKFNSEYNIAISIDNSVNDADQMIIVGDESLLKVAVSNIIENACKYSPDHAVNVVIRHIEKQVEIIFEDHGIGISEKDLQKVFEPFYRGVNALSYTGTGIGLSLVNQIITNYNGKIKLTSEAGKGTLVAVVLPIA